LRAPPRPREKQNANCPECPDTATSTRWIAPIADDASIARTIFSSASRAEEEQLLMVTHRAHHAAAFGGALRFESGRVTSSALR
jgi:hypothetical protein